MIRTPLSWIGSLLGFCLGLLILFPANGQEIPLLPAQSPADPSYTNALQKLRNNQFDEVLRLAGQRSSQNPQDTQARLLICLALLGKGEDQQALSEAQVALKMDPVKGLAIYRNMARFYYLKGRFYRALSCARAIKALETDPEMIRLAADIHLAQGRLKEARASLELLLSTSPDYLALARICLLQEAPGEAVRWARQAVSKQPGSLPAQIVLGSGCLVLDRLEEAKSAFQQCLKISPNFPLAQYNLALIALLKSEPEVALQGFEKCGQTNSTLVTALVGQTAIQLTKGQPALALKAADQAARLATNDALASLALGISQALRNDAPAARQAFKKAAGILAELSFPDFGKAGDFNQDPPQVAARLLFANLLLKEGLYRQTVRFSAAGKSRSAVLEAMLAVTRARAENKLGNRETARQVYEGLATQGLLRVTPLVELAELAAQENQLLPAIALLEKATQANPASAELQLSLGNLRFQAGKIDEAIKSFSQVITLAPQACVGYNQLAWTLADKKRELEPALKYALQGHSKEPKDSNMADTLGWIYHLLGRNEEAVRVYATLPADRIQNPTLFYHRGVIYRQLNRPAEALKSFEESLNLSDQFPEAKEAMAALAQP